MAPARKNKPRDRGRKISGRAAASPAALSGFTKKVISLIKKIPIGRVATYGQIAILAGKPHGARGVSWILHSCSRRYRLPWHRVLGAQGKISFPREASHYALQKRRLEHEGVEFMAGDRIELRQYQWKVPTRRR